MIPTKLLLQYGLPLAIVLGGVVVYTKAQREIGARDVLLAATNAKLDSLQSESHRIEIQFKTDTIRLRKLVTRTDTLVAEVVSRITDTVFVKQVIAAQDTTIKVCTLTLSECAKGWETSKRQVSLLEGQVRLVGGKRPSVAGDILRCGLLAGAGYVIGNQLRNDADDAWKVAVTFGGGCSAGYLLRGR